MTRSAKGARRTREESARTPRTPRVVRAREPGAPSPTAAAALAAPPPLSVRALPKNGSWRSMQWRQGGGQVGVNYEFWSGVVVGAEAINGN
jgi:hypothetical protein